MNNKFYLLSLGGLVVVLVLLYLIYNVDEKKEKMVNIENYDNETMKKDKELLGLQKSNEEDDQINPMAYFLDDGANGNIATVGNLCSLSCCSKEYKDHNLVEEGVNPDDYVKTNLFCGSSISGTGCMCVSKEQKEFLENRGNNV